MGTEKQTFLVVLSTGQENQYPKYVRVKPVSVDNSSNDNEMFKSCVKMCSDRVLNTDGKKSFRKIG